jgi:hypothetical protein
MLALIRFTIFFTVILLLVQPSQASVPRDPSVYFFEQSLGDLTEELETAREEVKKVCLYSSSWMNAHFATA